MALQTSNVNASMTVSKDMMIQAASSRSTPALTDQSSPLLQGIIAELMEWRSNPNGSARDRIR